MERLLKQETRHLTTREQKFIAARSVGGKLLGWTLVVFMVLFSAGLVVFPFVMGEIWFGVFMTAGVMATFAFMWDQRITDLPDIEEPVVTSWTGQLTQKASRLGTAKFWFGGRRVHLPSHWADFIPGERTFEGEAAVLPDDDTPFLLKTSTGLSVEKEVEWGLLDTFSARPQRRIGCRFGFVFLLFSFLPIGLAIYEGSSFIELLRTWYESPVGIVAVGGTVLVGLPTLYYFVKHRRALWHIRENYWAEDVRGMPDREAFWTIKWNQIRQALALTVPGTALFLWLLKGLPILGAGLGVIIGAIIGYFTRVVRPTS